MSDQPLASERRSDEFVVKQSGTIAVVSHVPAWAWRCGRCGWLGTGWTSETGATKEAADHVWNDHGIAACHPGWYGGPHIWRHVQGTDSIDRCDRCEWEIGK